MLTMDAVLLLQGLESQTFVKEVKKGVSAFRVRSQTQLTHITPKLLESLLDKCLATGNLNVKVREEKAKLQAALRGRVFESFFFELEQVLEAYDADISELQKILLL